MGEGWSDWYAKDYLVDEFPGLDTLAPGDVHMGVYTDAVDQLDPLAGARLPGRARRRRPAPAPARRRLGRLHLRRLRQDRRRAGGPLRRRDLGRDAVGPAHRDRLGRRARGWSRRRCGCRRRSRRSWTCATRSCSPTRPPGGTRRDAIWTVFAARGMGYYASTTGAGDTAPLEDFSTAAGRRRAARHDRGRVTDAATGLAAAGRERRRSGSLDGDGRRGRALRARRRARAQLRRASSSPRRATTACSTGVTRQRERDDDARRRAAAQLGRASRRRDRDRQRRVRRPGLRPARGDRPERRRRRGRPARRARRQGDGRDAAGGDRRRPLRDRPGARAAATTWTAAAADVRIETSRRSVGGRWTVAATTDVRRSQIATA